MTAMRHVSLYIKVLNSGCSRFMIHDIADNYIEMRHMYAAVITRFGLRSQTFI